MKQVLRDNQELLEVKGQEGKLVFLVNQEMQDNPVLEEKQVLRELLVSKVREESLVFKDL